AGPSFTCAPLPELAVLPHNPPLYSCSRTIALRYQIVSSLPRQELPREAVQSLQLPCARRVRIPSPALPLRPFASKRRAVRVRTPSEVARHALCFLLHVRKQRPAIRASEMACRSL